MGVLHHAERPEFIEVYEEVRRRAQHGERPLPAAAAQPSAAASPAVGADMPTGRYEIRLSGSGGQGLILAAVILAEAAVSPAKKSCRSQSYGPEARGGASQAAVIISDDEIDYPEVEAADLTLCLSQPAFDKFAPQTRPGGLVLYDSGLVTPGVVQRRASARPAVHADGPASGRHAHGGQRGLAGRHRRRSSPPWTARRWPTASASGCRPRLVEANLKALAAGAAAGDAARPASGSLTRPPVGALIIVLGVVGLLAAAAAFGELSWDAVRRRHYLDIVVAAGRGGPGRLAAARLRRLHPAVSAAGPAVAGPSRSPRPRPFLQATPAPKLCRPPADTDRWEKQWRARLGAPGCGRWTRPPKGGGVARRILVVDDEAGHPQARSGSADRRRL